MGPGALLRDYLGRFRYVGPIREIPSRNHVPPRTPEPTRWASGLAAWDALAKPENNELVEQVSKWLWEEKRLNTGYQLVAKDVKEIEGRLREQMVRLDWEDESPSLMAKGILNELERLPDHRRTCLRDVAKGVDLAPHSVGVGLIQVIPVIAAILGEGAQVVQIEQPGLHLHPTQKAAIGDLLIQGALAETGKCLVIETHSEHSILRILKRIRQTARGRDSSDVGVRPDDVVTLYVEPNDGQTTVFEIAIGDDGEFLQPWPDSFFDQDYEERYG